MIIQLIEQVLVGDSITNINWFIQYKLQITKDLNSQTNNPTYFFEKKYKQKRIGA